jgi:branched-chain amino acid transport system ATP-binding protein
MGSSLTARALAVHFGGVKAVDGLDLELPRGEILGLIGPNGAGKTTLINALTGYQQPTGGTVALDGTDVTAWAPHRRARAGVVRTFQSIRLFAGLTACENVELGSVAVGLSRADAHRRALELLELAGLGSAPYRRASALSHGEQRRIGILRALATRPQFLLLDEPAAGLHEDDSDALMQFLLDVRDDLGCGVLLVEHDMRLVMRLSQRVQVLDFGQTISVGTPSEISNDRAVIEAYLGRAA